MPLLTTFIGYCWPLSMIRAFAHACVAWYQSRSLINSEVWQIQGSRFARHASMMENPFARPRDQYMNMGWQSMVPLFSASSWPPHLSPHWWVFDTLCWHVVLNNDLVLLEHFYRTTWIWFQRLKHACGRLYAWVWAGSVESALCTFNTDPLYCCARGEVGGCSKQEVCPMFQDM